MSKNHPLPCQACLSTGYCHRCAGQGCMDCNYTGDCLKCGRRGYLPKLFADLEPGPECRAPRRRWPAGRRRSSDDQAHNN